MHRQRPHPLQWVKKKPKRRPTCYLRHTLWGCVIKKKVWMRRLSGPQESLNCPADCPVEQKYSLHLSCVTKPWGVHAYLWLLVARLWKILQQHWHKWQCSCPLSSLFLDEEPPERVVCIRFLEHPCKSKEIKQSQQSTADSTTKQRNISQFTSFLKR